MLLILLFLESFLGSLLLFEWTLSSLAYRSSFPQSSLSSPLQPQTPLSSFIELPLNHSLSYLFLSTSPTPYSTLLKSHQSPRVCPKGMISPSLTHKRVFLSLNYWNHACDLTCCPSYSVPTGQKRLWIIFHYILLVLYFLWQFSKIQLFLLGYLQNLFQTSYSIMRIISHFYEKAS